MISNKLTKSSGYELEVKKQEMNDIWNTKRVNEALDAIDNGIPLKSSPFFMKNVNLRKPNLVYDYTQYELDEITKCANDICYFADTYCKVMTDDGVQKIKLRDYQRAMLKHYQNNRFAICLAARQIGKCLIFNTLCDVKEKINNLPSSWKIGDIYNKGIKFSLLAKIKLFLYKIYQKL